MPESIDAAEPIAIVGMGGRFPGADRVERFWHNLREGVESISFFDEEELLASGVDKAKLADPYYVRAKGYLADGELYVCGRTKDLIIRHGRKYHPPDLEFAITDLQGIRSTGVVVFGVSRVDEGDEVVAVLETRASAAQDDLPDRVRRRVREAAGLEVDRVLVAPPGTIPRTSSGKIRRAETRARFEAGTLLPDRPAILGSTP